MLYRTVHQMVKLSRAGEDKDVSLVLGMLRTGWRITNTITLPTNKTVVFLECRIWCRPIRFLVGATKMLTSRKRSYSVKRG